MTRGSSASTSPIRPSSRKRSPSASDSRRNTSSACVDALRRVGLEPCPDAARACVMQGNEVAMPPPVTDSSAQRAPLELNVRVCIEPVVPQAGRDKILNGSCHDIERLAHLIERGAEIIDGADVADKDLANAADTSGKLHHLIAGRSADRTGASSPRLGPRALRYAGDASQARSHQASLRERTTCTAVPIAQVVMLIQIEGRRNIVCARVKQNTHQPFPVRARDRERRVPRIRRICCAPTLDST